MSLIMGPHPPVKPKGICIKEVRAFCFEDDDDEKDQGGGADCHKQKEGHWIVDSDIANPMSVYEEYRNSRTSWGIDAMGTILVEVELDNGMIGVGISIGGEAACYIVERHLYRFVEGQDPANVELMWDQMFRATMNYGRKGIAIQAISAVDLAIWDALGKLRQMPVYAMLGGKTKENMPVYATTSRPDLAQKMGFHGAKFPLPFGPAQGQSGMTQNINLVRKWRQLVGPDFPLMIDCYMALTVPYAIELARKCEPYDVKWIEETLPPDQYDGYAQIKKQVSTTLLTTGEHEYTRWGFRQLLEQKCCDVLQPDITWCGGMTEARRIVALASAFDIPVIPHGSSVYSYHLQICFPSCPIAEFLVMHPRGEKVVSYFGKLFKDEPLPSGGYVTLPDKPGFGVELNREELNLKRPYNHATGEQIRQTAAVNLVAAARAYALTPAPVKAPKPKPTPKKKVTKVKKESLSRVIVTHAIGFRRGLARETVDGLSYQESGDWCKKVGISLAGTKTERINRLKEYLQDKPEGFKEY
jgi:L-rhamnonate dehydratase